MEQLYRNNEGNGQREHFPGEREPSRFWQYLPYVAVGAVILMLIGSAYAEESRPMILTQAVLCDTEDQLKDQIDAMSSADAASIDPVTIEGCGQLAYPSPAIVTPTVVYENKYLIVQLATIDIPGLPLQYGYIAYRMKPPEEEI